MKTVPACKGIHSVRTLGVIHKGRPDPFAFLLLGNFEGDLLKVEKSSKISENSLPTLTSVLILTDRHLI